jgi:hypothetical protein
VARIFLSYRRDDSSGYAGRLYDRLCQHFGRDNLFMDIDTISPGSDFVEAIKDAVGSCDVLLAVIGRQWLTSTDPLGQRRLDNPEDFVRLEIMTALARNIRMIPVLVGGATMPHPTELPAVLQALARRQALVVGDHFYPDVDHLIAAVERVHGAAPSSREQAAELPIVPSGTLPHDMTRWWRQPTLLVAALGVLAVIITVLLSQPTIIQSTTGPGSPVIGKTGRDVTITQQPMLPPPAGQSPAPPSSPSSPPLATPPPPGHPWWQQPPVIAAIIAAIATLVAALIQRARATSPAEPKTLRPRRKS